MSTESVPLPERHRARTPDAASEKRLVDLREEAARRGRVPAAGVRPPGAPFPQASPQTGYYGIPLLKQPQWTWQVPLYFFVGGAAGSAAVIGSMADWIGDDYELARHARFMALGGAILSGGLLTWDLGRPSRFLAMLRIFKLQSPMSVGAWILTAFGNATAAAAFADIVRDRFGDSLPVRLIGGAGRMGSVLFGMPFSNYTGVLIGATTVPVWNRNIRTLPIHFGASGLQSAVSMLELMGHRNPALNFLGIASALLESLEGFTIEIDHGEAMEPLKRGVSGWLTRAGGLLSGPVPLALRLMAAIAGPRRSPWRRWAAISGIAGSLITRYAWMQAGHASARNWKLPLQVPAAVAEIEPGAAAERELRRAG